MRNRCVLELVGFNIEQCLNVLKKKNIEVYNVYKNAKCNTEIEINNKKYTKTVKILKFFNMSYVLKKDARPLAFAEKHIKRMGVLIGILISVIIVFYASMFVWQINVDIYLADENIAYREQILDYLKNKGVRVGAVLTNINCEMIERDLSSSFENLSEIVVEKNGVKIFVSAKEKEKFERNINVPIIAEFDGVVEKIDVYCGVAKVKEGDVVLAGQVLVEPKNEVCKAEIFIKTWMMESETQIIDAPVLKRTGKKIVKNTINFGDYPFLKSQNNCDFEYFETEENSSFISNNLFIPIKMNTTIFYELEFVLDVKNEEELEQQMKDELCDKLLQKTQGKYEIENIVYFTYKEANTLRVVASFEYVLKVV